MSDELETAEKGMGADPALPDAVAAPSAPRPALDADQLAGQMHQNMVYLQRQSRLLRNRQHHIEQARVKLAREKETIHEQMLEVARQQTAVAAERDEIAALHTRLDEREQDIQQTRAAVEAIRASVQQRADDLGRKQEQLDSREAHLTALQ